MALRVVGTGLGRTGTKSLQTALNMLGFGPCHHMVEVFAHPESMPLWIEAAAGRPDWDAIFAGYSAAVDYPVAAWWREVTAYYPDARVIHTQRDPDRWFDSTQATIFKPAGPVLREGPMKTFFEAVLGPILPHMHDRDWMTAYFRRHNEAVAREIAPERLLVYEAGQGWEPLCAFLGAPVPDEPYPSENSTAAFQAAIAARDAGE